MIIGAILGMVIGTVVVVIKSVRKHNAEIALMKDSMHTIHKGIHDIHNIHK